MANNFILEITQDLAQRVRQHRKRSGLTQQQLAQFAGIGKTAVFDIEHAKPSVQWDTLLKVLQVLNIQVKFISILPDAQEAKS